LEKDMGEKKGRASIQQTRAKLKSNMGFRDSLNSIHLLHYTEIQIRLPKGAQ
jgi:hypothetical protein